VKCSPALSEVLARAANLLLARDLLRVIANANLDDEIQLKQGARIIERSSRPPEVRQ
jgi:hypothetical protein